MESNSLNGKLTYQITMIFYLTSLTLKAAAAKRALNLVGYSAPQQMKHI